MRLLVVLRPDRKHKILSFDFRVAVTGEDTNCLFHAVLVCRFLFHHNWSYTYPTGARVQVQVSLRQHSYNATENLKRDAGPETRRNREWAAKWRLSKFNCSGTIR